MTSFQDGPAKGQNLNLQRTPRFLRVTEKLGSFDALDQLDDEPEWGDVLYAYEIIPGATATAHISMRGKGGRREGRWIRMAIYSFLENQPEQEIMKHTALWQAWCLEAAK
jgi:hypothetical protein